MSGRTKPKRPRRYTAEDNPWMRAAKRKIAEDLHQQTEREFQAQLTESRLHLWILRDGDDATSMLAKLSVIIGTPCEAGARTMGRSEPWVRQLHGALRSVQAMCLDGYKWNASLAPALERAIDLSVQHTSELPVDVFTNAWIEANGMATLVLAHKVDTETVSA